MQTATVGSILESISVLDPDDQLFVTEILNKRAIEIRRNQILARAREAEENYKNGNTQTVTVAELMMLSANDDWIDYQGDWYSRWSVLSYGVWGDRS